MPKFANFSLLAATQMSLQNLQVPEAASALIANNAPESEKSSDKSGSGKPDIPGAQPKDKGDDGNDMGLGLNQDSPIDLSEALALSLGASMSLDLSAGLGLGISSSASGEVGESASAGASAGAGAGAAAGASASASASETTEGSSEQASLVGTPGPLIGDDAGETSSTSTGSAAPLDPIAASDSSTAQTGSNLLTTADTFEFTDPGESSTETGLLAAEFDPSIFDADTEATQSQDDLGLGAIVLPDFSYLVDPSRVIEAVRKTMNASMTDSDLFLSDILM